MKPGIVSEGREGRHGLPTGRRVLEFIRELEILVHGPGGVPNDSLASATIRLASVISRLAWMRGALGAYTESTRRTPEP